MRKIKLIFNNFIPKSLLAFLLISILVISFQNCSQADVRHLQNPILNLKFQGNGEPYDGKPKCTRPVPGLTCESKNIAIGELEIPGDMTTVVTNKNSCQHISEQVPTSLLERSSFSSRYTGFGGGVYTYLENRNENIKEGIFTEAWCRAIKPDHSGSLYELALEKQEAGRNLSTREIRIGKSA